MTRDLARLRREVSRSFDLSMVMLPVEMREPVSIAYLLARASDTLADAALVPVSDRLGALTAFDAELRGGGAAWRREGLADFINKLEHAGEARLLGRMDDCISSLQRTEPEVRQAILEVLDVILSGQRLDLERMAVEDVVVLTADELEDYCFRVAGCVGRFWTKVGFLTLGTRFSEEPPELLEKLGVNFGKGLQLVNILRDVPNDLKNGRCYLPVRNWGDREELVLAAAEWRDRATAWLRDGERYAEALVLRRLRAASVLPALLGEETIALLDRSDWMAWERGVKIGRPRVRRCLLRSLLW